MYSLLLSQNDVMKELTDPKKYPPKVFRQIITKILELSGNPRPHDAKRIEGGYRVDSGEYRIWYEVDDAKHIVIIHLVGKRNDDEIYQRLKRKLS